jgi:hypothetical protein
MKSLVYSSNFLKLTELLQNVEIHSSVVLQTNLSGSLQCIKENQFERVLLHLSNLEELESSTFQGLYTVLKPDGLLRIVHDAQKNKLEVVCDKLIIAGFKLDNNNNQSNIISANKPAWAGQGVATLKKKKVNQVSNGESESKPVKIDIESEDTQKKPANPVTKSNPFAKVKIVNQSDLIDENNLLANETEYKKIETSGDCSTKPKACKNCSCGRAEMETGATETPSVLEKIEKGKVTSSCGNCYLGDAFRCGSCPYKGLPAFKSGDKVKLDLSKDSLGGVLNEGSEVQVSNGKVKLQL